jgi:hypothetical protein
MADLNRLEDGGSVLRLDIGLDGPTLGRLIEAQERFLGLIREVARDVVGILSYRIPDLAPGVFALLGVFGVLFVALMVVQGGPVLFGIAWLGLMAWLGFNYLVRMAHAVAVTNGTLFWTTYFRTEEVRVSEIERMTLAFGGSVQVIECRDGRRLRVPIMQGYEPFVTALAREYLSLKIDLGRYARTVNQVQVFRPRDDLQDRRDPPT